MLSFWMQVALLVSPQQIASSQEAPVLWLSTRSYHADRPGAESSSSGKALFPNRRTPFVTYRLGSDCGFAAGGFTAIDSDAVLGWEVLAIPKVVTADHVRLSVTWSRKRNHKIEARGSVDVHMRPGDSVPLDIASTADVNDQSCKMTSAELRLDLDPVRWARLNPARASIISTDLWLVRQLSNGREDTQQINVRSALNEEVPFYFDEVHSGALAMSVLGRITARSTESGAIALDFAGERLLRNGTSSMGRGFTAMKPGEQRLLFDSAQDVVSVEFPLSGDAAWRDLGSQKLSIRIRSRRIR